MKTRLLRSFGIIALLVACGSCSEPARAPIDINGTPSDRRVVVGSTEMTPEQIQSEVMIFADRYWAVVSQVMDDFRRSTDSPQRRLGAQSLKIVSVDSAVRIATQQNPVTALLDMTVMVTLMNQVWVEHWAGVFGEAPGGPASTAFASLEQEIWTIAGRVLSAAELEALRVLIAEMRAAYPGQVYVVNLRASEFASDQAEAIQRVSGGASLLRLFALDPLSSLAPATRELQASRLLAERAFFYMARLPGLLSWRTDRTLLFAAAMPEVAEARATAEELREVGDRFGEIAETIMPEIERQRVDTIEQLFNRLQAERSGAVDDVFNRIAGEREAVFEALRTSERDASTVLGHLDSTADRATILSESLQVTLAEARELTQAVAALRSDINDNSDGSGGGDFDIAEYESAARTATETATELTTLVAALNDLLRAPEWSERSGDANAAISHISATGSELMHRAFMLAFGLVAFTVVIVFLAAIGYRALAIRMNRAELRVR